MLKNFTLIICLALVCALPVHAGQPPQFFEALYDVPVMPGLDEIPEMSMVFDKPGGRIAQSVAEAPSLAARDIEAFYNESLPQLGWSAVSQGAYLRENERLKISIEDTSGTRIVRFLLEPR